MDRRLITITLLLAAAIVWFGINQNTAAESQSNSRSTSSAESIVTPTSSSAGLIVGVRAVRSEPVAGLVGSGTVAVLPPGPSLPNPVSGEVAETTRTDPVTVLANRADDGHSTTGQTNGQGAGGVAAFVTVTSLTWRYDTTTDLAQILDGAAATQLLDELAPETGELERRRNVREVSWAITTRTASTDAGTMEVDVERHLITATTPETVTVLQVTVTVEQVSGGWRVTRLDISE
jgi:hypothetical protein